MAPLYHLNKATNGSQFHFSLRGPDGEPLLRSVAYASREQAERGIDDCRANSSLDARYQRLSTTDGPFAFRLLSPANQVLGQSNDYFSLPEREAGVAACKRNGPTAAIQNNM